MRKLIKIGDRICKINTSVDSWEYMEDFIMALCHVDKGYYMFSTDESKNNKQKYKYSERIFAYEFYHQYRRIMEKKNVYEGIFLNGEQTKNQQIANYIGDYTPDLVLHKKLDGMSKDSQLWLCEIKMVESRNPLSDLEKFEKMKELNFKENVFLYAGGCIYLLLSKLDNKLNKATIDKDSAKNYICVCSYYAGNILRVECHRVGTLLDMIKKLDMKEIKKIMRNKKKIFHKSSNLCRGGECVKKELMKATKDEFVY